MRKVFPTQANGLYNITTSADVFRPDRPLRVTLWGPPFKGFLLVAAEEGAKDWPTGVFYSDDGSAHRMSCLGQGDTATHVNSSYKDSVSVLWYGPDNMAVEQVQFIATVVVNVTIYYTNIRSSWIRVDPSIQATRQGGDGGPLGVTMDPWLLGQENQNQQNNDPWYSGRTGSGNSWGGGSGNYWSGTGTGTGGSWGNNWGSGGGNNWGSGGGSSWGGSGSYDTTSKSGSGNNWDWNNQGQGTGTGASTGTGTGTGNNWWRGSGSSGSSGTGSNWNWGQTTTSAWNNYDSGYWGTTTLAPKFTQAPVSNDTYQTASAGAGTQTDTGSSGGSAAAGGTGSGSNTGTGSTSIDWIKNIPTQTWYEILRRLGFGLSNPVNNNANTGSGGATVKK